MKLIMSIRRNDTVVKKVREIGVDLRRDRWSKWVDVIRGDMRECRVNGEMMIDKDMWRAKI